MAQPRLNPHDPNEWFSANHAARLAGLSMSMVNYLCRTGIVGPSCTCARGHGKPRHYSFGDVVALRLVSRLSKSGVSVLRLKKAMRGLRKFHPEITLTSLPASRVVTNGVELYLYSEGEAIERAFDGQYAFAFVVELTSLQQEVAGQLKKLRREMPLERLAA